MTDVTQTSHQVSILAEAEQVPSTSVPLSANKFQSSYPMGWNMKMPVLTLSLECHGEKSLFELPSHSSDMDDGTDRGNLLADMCGPTVC